ncbi:hypothetical protein JCM8097_006660 [Rhodosporidiobolus ruineniae]
MADSPPLSRLPPPLPYEPNGHSASSASPPVPPKSFRVAGSPTMNPSLVPVPVSPDPSSSPAPVSPPSPSSEAMSPSRSWTRINPQQPFVNGRGNVQLPGAPRQFVPSGSESPSAGGSPSVSNGSPVLGVQHAGQQAYVRRDPSPGPSSSSSRQQQGSPSLSSSTNEGGSAVGYLPSQFGVRQRVAIKTSSRPAPPRASSSFSAASANGARRGSAVSASSEAGSLSPTQERERREGNLPALPHEKGKGPMYPSLGSSSATPVAAAFAQGVSSPVLSTDSHSSGAGPRSSSLSHHQHSQPGGVGAGSSTASSSTVTSPTSVSPHISPTPSSSALAPSTSNTSTPTSSAFAPPPPPARHLSPSPAPSAGSHTSILDRPRPKTPDPFGSFSATSFASRDRSERERERERPPQGRAMSVPLSASTSASSSTSTGARSILDRPRPKTPEAALSLSTANLPASAASSTQTSPILSRAAAPVPAPVQTSVLDRPRPKTPDAGAAFRFGGGRERELSGGSGGEAGVFRFGAGAGPGAGGSAVDRKSAGSRPKPPEAAAVFAFSVPPLEYGASPSSSTPGAGGQEEDAERGAKKPRPSVMDRPRPKTPDAQGWLDSPGTARPFGTGAGAGAGGGKEGESPTVERRMFAGHQAGESLSSTGHGTTLSSHDSLARSTLPSGLTASHSAASSTSLLPASSSASPARPSFDSFASSSASPSRPSHSYGQSTSTSSFLSSSHTSNPSLSTTTTAFSPSPLSLGFSDSTPLLKLDFDFGGSPFGNSETMFGLTDLLKPSSSSSPAAAPALTVPEREDEGEDATTPTPTTERKDLGAAPSSAALAPGISSSGSSISGAGSFLGAPSSSSGPSTAGTGTGRLTPRKEPPKVDLKLELELEMERAIPPNRNILDERERERERERARERERNGAGEFSSGDEGERAKRVRRVREDDDDPSSASPARTRAAPPRAPGGSISSLGSVMTGTASISDASVLSSARPLGASPKPQKRRRRRSLASLLSIGSASLLGGGAGEKEKEKEKDEPKRSKTPEPAMFARSFTPEPGLASSTATVPAHLPSTATGVQPPSISTFAPRLSLDKSLPPTPLAQPSPPVTANGDPLRQQQQQPDSPSKRSAGGALGRQLSRLRNRSNPSPLQSSSTSSSSAQQQPARQPGFQVLSATTTRKRGAHQAGKESISSLATNESFASSVGPRRESYEFGASAAPLYPNGAPFSTFAAPSGLPALAPPVTAQPPSAAPAAPASVPFGRRLVERFNKISSSSTKSASDRGHGPSESWTAPVKDHSAAEPNGPPRQSRRRASLSSLLGVGAGSASADGHGVAPSAAASSSGGGGKKILGMSLPAGRKSEDLLLRKTGEREMRREWEHPSTVSEAMAEPRSGRRSFDALTSGTERAAVPRRPSTDDLLSLATAKLSQLAVSNEQQALPAPLALAPPALGPPLSAASAEDATFETADTSSVPGSGHSTPSDEVAAKADAVVAHAALISRSGPGGAATVAALSAPVENGDDVPLYGTRTAAPVLVRSDSLRSLGGGRPSAATTAPPILAAAPVVAPSSPPSAPVPALNGNEAKKTVPSTAMWRKQRSKAPDSGLGSDASMSSAWLGVEDSLAAYSAAVRMNRNDRGVIITDKLLPFLRREEDNPAARVNETLAQRQRDILFGWLMVVTNELREMQPTHRGACLEAVAAIAESHFLSIAALEGDPAGQARYRTAIVQVLDFAVEKLNDKAVYANTLVFSGRVFALSFFRVEGVALKLLRALPPVKRQGLKRILDETGVKESALPEADLDAFPTHLHPLCLRDFRAYASLLIPLKSRQTEDDDHYLVRDGDVQVEMSGNWLIRWTASDSDLPFAFYRAYHRQLASHLIPFEARQDIVDQPALPPSAIVTAPGFLFLAASLLDKADSLVHRNLRSVTSIGPNSSFNMNDSANLSFGQKPKVLELAHRRIVQTFLDIVGGPPTPPGADVDNAPDADARRHVFSGMLQVWIRACVKRTSMWDSRSVFLLLDMLEGLMYTLSYPPPVARDSDDGEDAPAPKPDEAALDTLDIKFIFHFVKIILSDADNTVTIMRTIAFLYSHFEIFTLRTRDREELCRNVILDEKLFTRLFLHWNGGVRGYFIRLLVWRLSRLGVVAQEQNPEAPPDKDIVAIFNLLNVRLEALRKRHDALEPLDSLSEEDDFFRPKRSTICSTRGVKEAPWTVNELAEPLDEESDLEDEVEEPQELVRSLPPPPASASSGMSGTSSKKGDLKTVGKVVSWLKTGFGKKQGKSAAGSKAVPPLPDARIDPFDLDRTGSIRSRQDSLGPVTIEDDDISAETASQDWPSAPLPTTIETGIVPTESSPGPHTPAAPVDAPGKRGLLSVTPIPFPSAKSPQRTKSTRSEKRSSRGSFFSFEFENGMVTRSDVDPSVASSAASTTSVNTTGTGDTAFPVSPIRARHDPHSAISPRVSLRFSKRISILPPAALDLLKEASGAEAVPPIPAQYRQSVHVGYDKKLHPYAVRGLRDYEDALDEWTEWVARLQEEEDEGGKMAKTFVDVVPRLAVNWPLQQGED